MDDQSMGPQDEQEQEPLPGDEPVADEDFAAAEDAAASDEMDDAEQPQNVPAEGTVQPAGPTAHVVDPALSQERVEEAAQAREERHSDDSAA